MPGDCSQPKMSYANRFPPSKNTRYRSSWGPSSSSPAYHEAQVPRPSDEEEKYAELYHESLLSAQARQLVPLQEDLADWINKMLNIDQLTVSNFFETLDNGALLCRLARHIQEKAQEAVESGRATGPIPTIRARCWENATRGSFFSRDNMENFIQFCRRLGVHDNLLFESNDLVLHNHKRHVVLCLLEVVRLSSRNFQLEPSDLVQLETEIEAEQELDLHCLSDSGISHSSLVSWQYPEEPASPTDECPDKMKHSSSAVEMSTVDNSWLDDDSRRTPPPAQHESELRRSVSDNGPRAGSDGVPSDTTEDDWSRGSADDPDEVLSPSSSPSPSASDVPDHMGPITELDRRVRRATEEVQKSCHCSSGKCSKLKVRKVGEGRYHIAGRNVFIRLLKGRHMMVRVGGGWDTLERFLSRHDPCQVRVLSRASTPTHHHHHQQSHNRHSLSPLQSAAQSGKHASNSFLHIRAKYRSSAPNTPESSYSRR